MPEGDVVRNEDRFARPLHDEEVRGVSGDLGPTALSGMQQLQAFLDGRQAQPPTHHLTGLRLTETGLGSATFALPSTGWLTNAYGVVGGGALAFLSDAAFVSALLTGAEAGVGYSTSEMSINYIRWIGPPVPGTQYVARASAVHSGRQVGLSQVAVHDAAGRLLAHGTSRLVVQRFESPDEVSFTPPVEYPAPDPWQREPLGEGAVPLEVYDRMSGLESLRDYVEGGGTVPPVEHLLGLVPVDVSDGTATWSMPTSPWFGSPGPGLYGGAIAWGCQYALDTAVGTTVPPGGGLASLDLKVQFLRPIFAGSGPLSLRGEVTHRGTRVRVADASIIDEQGKVVAIATGSHLMVEDAARRARAGGLGGELWRPGG